MIKATRISVTAILACLIFILGAGSAMAYSDVPSDRWFYAPVTELSSKGIVTGNPDGTFKPNNLITRAEFAIIMAKALGLDAEDTSTYGDIKGHTAKGYIVAVSSAGVMMGYPDKTFRPDNKITRAEIASAIVRAYKLGESWGDYIIFDDIFNHWAEQDIQIANQNSIINGYPDDIFKPNAEATQAEAAAMISRAIFASERIPANGKTKVSGSVQLSAQNWRYEDAIYDSELDYSWPSARGKRFISIDVTVKNVGSSTIRLNKLGFELHLADGQKVDPDVDYYYNVFELRELTTGASETGTITFSVPLDADIAYIAYDHMGVRFPIKIAQKRLNKNRTIISNKIERKGLKG